MALTHDVTMEPHAQNMLMEIDVKSLKLTGRFGHRDYHGFEVAWQYKREQGKVLPTNLPKTDATDYTAKSDRTPFEDLHTKARMLVL